MKKTFIIAEAGVNHNGSIELAFELVNAAKDVGADCIKFQTFKAQNLVTLSSPKAAYQKEVTDENESQFDMLKKLELSADDFGKIKEYCDQKGIQFLSTPYNFEDVEILEKLDVDTYKIASGQIVELPFLEYIAKKGKKVILSTGMANMSEIALAVDCLRDNGNDNFILLQCNTNYPTSIEDANIRAMQTMREAFKIDVGYSDHVTSNYACYAAVALGACVIEKHFTLNRKMEGPDHSSSLEPEEFKELVVGIRQVEKALGSGIKTPNESEKRNIYGMRRSLVLNKNKKAGSLLEINDIQFKRPLKGLLPNQINEIIGKKINKDMEADEYLTLECIDFK